jgi:flagellar biosynthetic protein FliQ
MNPESVMTMGRQAMEVTLMVAAPLLLAALIIGLVVSIFQAATQINEATLSFIPKLVGIFLTLIIAGPWMLTVMLDYMRQVFTGFPALAN